MCRQSDIDNHANQINPNNDAYWESCRNDDRPDDWGDRREEEDGSPDDRRAESADTERNIKR